MANHSALGSSGTRDENGPPPFVRGVHPVALTH